MSAPFVSSCPHLLECVLARCAALTTLAHKPSQGLGVTEFEKDDTVMTGLQPKKNKERKMISSMNYIRLQKTKALTGKNVNGKANKTPFGGGGIVKCMSVHFKICTGSHL